MPNRNVTPPSRNIDDLVPEMRPIVRAHQVLCAERAAPIAITETLRTIAYQDFLWNQGRDANGRVTGPTVTNARGGRSWHNYGRAVDVRFAIPGRHIYLAPGGVPDPDFAEIWEIVGRSGEELGLRWGGRWKRPADRPHFEFSGGLDIIRDNVAVRMRYEEERFRAEIAAVAGARSFAVRG